MNPLETMNISCDRWETLAAHVCLFLDCGTILMRTEKENVAFDVY